MKRLGHLVTHDEVAKKIWKSKVSDAVLTVNISELRQALGDNPHTPEFIETVARRGYRFIGKVSADGSMITGRNSAFPSEQPHSMSLVGREAELVHLRVW